MDRDEQKVIEDVERFGWHVCLIPEDDEGPGFAYSIGLYKSYGQPEIIVFGLSVETMHGVVNALGELAKEGRRFLHGGSSGEAITGGYEVQFRDVAKAQYHEFLGYARWFYKGNGFPAVQCFWPDAGGRYPWDADAPDWLKRLQPRLDE